ncbi:hypothetical protein JXM67_10890 [candidate division WOR-3 bacterium]|nr:hypothetical protein [candidate division WOR-3 bacterium]
MDTRNRPSRRARFRNQVEKSTYSWGSRLAGDLKYVIVITYIIRGMNDFGLKSPCFSYFMDADIGKGVNEPGDDGHWDDMIGYSSIRDLAYAYDYNGSEPGWGYPAGHIGVTFIKTPKDNGLTGLEAWRNGSEIDHVGTDELKYTAMSSEAFLQTEEPNDIRFLTNSGTTLDMLPGETFDIIVGIVVGNTYDQLIDRTDLLRRQFGIEAVIAEPQDSHSQIEITTVSLSR